MLFNSIQSAQNGDQNEMLYLISRFQSVICKYGRKLAYEDANDDLLVDFIDFVTKFDFKKLNNLTDGAIVNYIVRSIYRLYLHRLQRLINEGHSLSIEELTPTQRNQIEYRSATYNDEDLSFVIPEGLLTDKEYTVIRAIYEYGLTSSSSKALLAGPGSSTLSVIDCELSGAGMDLGTRCLLFDVTVTLNEGEVPGLLLESGEVSVEFPLTERTGGVFSGSVAVPPEPLDGFQLYPTEVKAGQALIQEPLGNWNNVHMLLPVRLQKYLLTTPRFEAGDLWNGVLTTQAEDIHLEGAEGGNCAVKLRVYLDGALAQAEDSNLYFVSKEKCSTDCRSFVL